MTANLMEAPEFTAATAIRCPGCGSTHTARVSTPAQDNLLCKTCGTCWHPVASGTERVSPRQCPGCSLRRICEAAAG
ncbi:MAG: hypothetical protein ACM3ML_28780 [Micromonosporaceae bacterium]